MWRLILFFNIVAVFSSGLLAQSKKDQDCLRTFNGHSDIVRSIAFHPNGKQIISGGADRKIKFWDVNSGQCQRTLQGHEDWVQSLALSPDGQFLVSGGADSLVKIWDVKSGEQQRAFVGHKGTVASAVFSPDGRSLASCGRDKLIRVWDISSGKLLKSIGNDDFVTASCVKFSLDSKQIYFGGDALQLWDIESGKCLRTFKGHSDSIGDVAVNRTGDLIASAGSYNDHTVRLWEAKSGKALWKKNFTEEEGNAYVLAFASGDNVLISGHDNGDIRFWDVKSGKEMRTIKAHSGPVTALSADTKGEYFVSGGCDKVIKLWKVSSDETKAK